MQDLKITLIQTPQFWEDKPVNLVHFEELLPKTGTTDLVLLPEMFHTGFSMKATELAEDFENSLAVNWLKEKAQQHQTAIYTSFICKASNHFFNRGVFVFPNGEITVYDKRKLFTLAKEEQHYFAGTEEKIVEYKGFRLLLSICYDLRFPEILRNCMISETEAKYDVLLNVANWPERRSFHWKSLLLARAIENQCFLIGVNRIGTDENQLVYSGDSIALDPLGQTLSNIQPHQETVETVTLRKEVLYEVREKLNFLKDQ
ncbi:MAG: hypothetical protein J0G96_10655 [Flavobacteriia bacterium]|nr:hypothetical protein [Flavobacteriia bacterium]OJX35594.1 MAG: hypothetical protein BGO87_02925 [Flavobacteriia bacterium 40-80]